MTILASLLPFIVTSGCKSTSGEGGFLVMKKTAIILLVLGIALAVFRQDSIHWLKNQFAGKPMPYYQQRQEFFKNLSKEFYGVADFAEELELVNRTYKLGESSSELVEIIVPSRNAITMLKQRRTVASIHNDPDTRVASIRSPVRQEKSAAANLSTRVRLLKGSTGILLVAVILISVVLSLISFVRHRRRQKVSPLLRLSGEELVMSDDRILVDFDVSRLEDNMPEVKPGYLKKVA